MYSHFKYFLVFLVGMVALTVAQQSQTTLDSSEPQKKSATTTQQTNSGDATKSTNAQPNRLNNNEKMSTSNTSGTATTSKSPQQPQSSSSSTSSPKKSSSSSSSSSSPSSSSIKPPRQHDLLIDESSSDPFDIRIHTIQQEFDMLNIFTMPSSANPNNTHTVIEVKPSPGNSTTCWSVQLLDFIDSQLESEYRYVRIHFARLFAQSFSAVGIETLHEIENEIYRLFVTSNGELGYCYGYEYVENENNELVRTGSFMNDRQQFSYSQGDEIQVIYDPEAMRVIIYNSSKDNIFIFNEELIRKLPGEQFRVFACVSMDNEQMVLSNEKYPQKAQV